MPGFDRTGPQGQGPRTGRGMGYCAAGRGRAWSGGRGRFGRGQCFGGCELYWSHPSIGIFDDMTIDEQLPLEVAMSEVRTELDNIKKRIEEIDRDRNS